MWIAYVLVGIVLIIGLAWERGEYVKWRRREQLSADTFVQTYYPGRLEAEAASWLRAIIETHGGEHGISRLRPCDIVEEMSDDEAVLDEVLHHLEIDYGSFKQLGGMGPSFDDVVQFLVKWTPRVGQAAGTSCSETSSAENDVQATGDGDNLNGGRTPVREKNGRSDGLAE
jgi:hypothetical protein